MVYKLVLGDWSEDGHHISKDFLFDCNHSVGEIRQAYKDSCKKLGVTFNHNKDYTGLGITYHDERMVWTEYEEDDMSQKAFDILNEAGCFNGIEYETCRCDGGATRYYIGNKKDCARLIMNFIALSMPKDFTYELLNVEPINGWWNPDLNVQFGYGLFDD